MEPCKIPEFWEICRTVLMFQYYFTVSGNFFPTLCLHALLITCISSNFFHFLPVFSSFFRKKLEEIPFFQFLPFFPEETYFFRKFPNPAAGQGFWHPTPKPRALPKNMWRVCAATLTLIFKPPVTEWPILFFTFCSHLMTPIFKMLSHFGPPFFEIFIGENGRHALTEWRPFSPINDHLVICSQYLFGRRDLCSC